MKLSKGRRCGIALIAAFLILAASFLLFRQTPFYYQIRSYVLLRAVNTATSISAAWQGNKICVRLPDGRSTPETDWSPQVSLFRPGTDFTEYAGRDADLTILYNFGAFIWGNSGSSVLDPHSPYYSAFYGAYIIKDSQGPFGFTPEGNADPRMLALITSYDWSYLVLSSLGCYQRVTAEDFLRGDYTQQENITYAGLAGWIRMDCIFEGRGLWHTSQRNRQGYLQFGLPPAGSGEDFTRITLYGRAYVRYLDEQDVTLYLYMMTADPRTLDECDQRILSRAEIVS